MYRRPKFLEVLIKIREEMAREADYDTDLFAELIRSGQGPRPAAIHSLGDGEPKPKASGKNGRSRG